MYQYLRAADYLPDPLLALEVRRVTVPKGTEPHHAHEFMEMVLVVEGAVSAGCQVDRAAALLRGTPKTVSEIAAETGLAGGSYLARAFRARYGCAPLEFRLAQGG